MMVVSMLVGVVVVLFAGQVFAIDIGTSDSYRQQRLESWGTSLAWWGNELGGWSGRGPRNQVLDLLFGETNSLGLNYARYNIGAGQNPSLSIPRPGATMDAWVPLAPSNVSDPSTWQWDLSADATQRWVLDQSLARGVAHVEAFANSAPWWMTVSQDVTGAPNSGQSNLARSYFDEFAHYLVEVRNHFENNLGIHFETLSPMNEPGAGWWTSPGNQEGMNIPKGTDQSLLIQATAGAIQSSGLAMRLAAPEETSATDSIDSWSNPAFDASTRALVDQINTHTYPYRGGSGVTALVTLRGIADTQGLRVYVSEYGTGGGSSPLAGGIALANQLTADLNILRAEGWSYWQAVENDNGSGWGLLVAPFEGGESFVVRKQYQVLRQFTEFIRPGAHVLETTDSDTVAAYDPRADTTTLVFTNDAAASDTNTYNLLDRPVGYTRTIRTTGGDDLRSLGPASVTGAQIAVIGPATSVTTVVVHHHANRINNANFDLGTGSNGSAAIMAWQTQGGVRFYSFGDNTGDGSGSGVLWADNVGNQGSAYQTGIGDADTDLTGVAFEFSLDMRFQNAGASHYDANTYLGLQFYGANDQVLVHDSANDFMTLVEPHIGTGSSVANDSQYRTFRTARYIAPPGTRYVRPVIRYTGVQPNSTDWVYFDNAFLHEVHPLAAGRQWIASGSGEWNNTDNWRLPAQVDQNGVIYLGDAIAADASISVEGEQSIEQLTFFSDHAYELNGTGNLRFATGTTDALVDARRGSHTIGVAATAGSDLVIRILPGAQVTFDEGLDLAGHALTKLGAGILSVEAGFVMHGAILSVYATDGATIHLGGDASLDGDLQVLAVPGAGYGLGTKLELATYASLGDTFDSVTLPAVTSNLRWLVDYGATALTASVLLAGDFNADGVVDTADYIVWRDTLGSTTDLRADSNNNAVIDEADYANWRTQFGTVAASIATTSTSAPEPPTLMVMLLCWAVAAVARRI